ncbi:deoxycytidyl transferase [Trapelia coarctata]|nr:deoxycytidyl transferase [Trapelia coarctata]
MGSRLEANSSAVRKRIETHTFDNEEGEEYEPSKFGGFTDYFRRKKIKLQNLDAELRSSSDTDNPPIFRGVVAHVNGYTQPSLNDLHTMIVSYGGGFMQYLDGKTTVTHIIASNLTPKKKIEFRRYRIVKPAWVVDSIKAGRLLSWENYRVVDEGINQQVLGFENGNVVSQANTPSGGYREQTDTSWYTSQVKEAARLLDHRPLDAATDGPSFTPQPGPFEDSRSSDVAGKQIQASDAERFPGDISEPPSPELEAFGSPGAPRMLNQETAGGSKEPIQSDVLFESIKNSEYPDTSDALHQLSREISSELDSPSAAGQMAGDSISPAKKAKMTAEEHNANLLSDPRVWKSTVVNPDFLKQYYEESRLHHLSTWKAELKSQLQALALEKSASQEARRRPPGARRYILHVDFDSFFAAVSLRKYPQYVDKPAVVAHGGGAGSEIASCNYPARKFGIKNGMWMKAAQQLCSDIKVLPYDFKAYEEASRDFYDAAMNTDGIVQSVSVDECLIDVSFACVEAGGHDGKAVSEGSIWREQAKADEIALQLRGEVKRKTGCAVSIGIGGNILLAKIATRKAKPAGQYQIKPDEVLEVIGVLSVQDLPGVAYSIGGKLEEIGVRLVRDAREVTKEKLITALGPKTGQKIWEYARGIDRVEVGDQVVRKSVSAEVNWGIRFATQEQADEFVQSICEELRKRLLNEGVKGRQLTLKIMRKSADAPLDPPKHLGHGKCDTFNKSVVLGVATNSAEVLGREAISIMRGWGFPPGELRGIGVQVTKLEPLKGPGGGVLESSQKRLQFTKPSSNRVLKQVDDPIDEVESPQKPKAPQVHPAAALTASKFSDSEPATLLNTLGTQFVLPTQVDPEVLAELPADIRSKFQSVPKMPNPSHDDRPISVPMSRSQSPALPLDALPSESQLDQETLNALPADVRAEVLAFYKKSPQKARTQAVLPQSPRKNRSIKIPPKKLTTPTKKRTGLLSRGRPAKKLDSNSTLTQSNFVATRPAAGLGNSAETDEVSAEFLAALPEDIRLEVLAQQRRERLMKRGGIDIAARKKIQRTAAAPYRPRRIHLEPRAPPPTFTGKKLSSLPDLREAVTSWFEEFREEEPYKEDVDALVVYLRRVIVEEKDMSKAVSVVRWLDWVIDQGDGAQFWAGALKHVQEGVQLAVKERGLGMVVF